MKCFKNKVLVFNVEYYLTYLIDNFMQTLFFSAFDIFMRHRGRVRVVPLCGQRPADAPAAVGSPLAPPYLPLRLRLHA